jgi:myo-inositol-1(or 4)-monophosphatase
VRTDADESELLEIAVEAAEAAARELRARFGTRQSGIRSKSTPTDPVSDADVAAERAIRAVLEHRRPDDAILGEEGGETGAGSALRWVVDPLDGTVNFLYGIPQFAVSVAVEDAAGSVAGVVVDPIRQECFAAGRSSPPTLGGVPFTRGLGDDLGHTLLATGFGYDPGVRARQAAVVSRVLPRVRDIRRAGAAALDLAWCACGRLDAYYERGVKRWDVAAGELIAVGVGLSVRTLPAGPMDAEGILAAPPALLDGLLELIG